MDIRSHENLRSVNTDNVRLSFSSPLNSSSIRTTLVRRRRHHHRRSASENPIAYSIDRFASAFLDQDGCVVFAMSIDHAGYSCHRPDQHGH